MHKEDWASILKKNAKTFLLHVIRKGKSGLHCAM